MKYRYRNESEMKDSGVEWLGKIPNEWEVKKIKNIFELKKEKSDEKKPTVLSLTQRGLKIRDVSNNEGQLASTYIGYTKIDKNDFILNPMDLISGYTDKADIEGVISPAYTTFRCKKGVEIGYDFYKKYFQMHYHHNFLFPWGQGVSFEHRWTLNNETFLNLPILTTELIEQEKISNFLDEKTSQFDSIISKKEALIQRLEEAKKSLISEVVTGKVKVVKSDDGYELVKRSREEMKNSGVIYIGNVPNEWSVCKFKNISNFVTGGTPDRNNISSYYDNANTIWVRSTDLNNHNIYDSSEKITEEAIKQSNCKILPRDTLVIAMYGGSGTIGKCGILKNEATTNQALCAILPNESKYDSYFILNLLNWIRPHWMIYAVGTRVDPNISKDIIINMNIPLPTLSEQKVIAEYLELNIMNLNKLIDKSKRQIKKIQEAKQSLISEAVTGKIEILD